ncbi:MAG: hypothetical protein HZA24_04975 [Nitrospirae bacterium]|nr:hypothetical protein [Nitrospirota bacterium]
MRDNLKRVLTATALSLALAACGGGGGGTTTSNVAFTPAGAVGSSNLLSVVFDPAASTQNVLVLDLVLSSVEGTLDLTTTQAGVAADLTYDSSWMTFDGITVNGANATQVAAATDQGAANTLVIGLTDVQGNAGSTTLAKLSFTIDGTQANNAVLALDNLAFVGTTGALLSTHAMNGAAGTVTNTP